MGFPRSVMQGAACGLRMVREVKGLILPRGCAGCDLPDTLLCPDCARLLTLPVFSDAPAFALGRALACGPYLGPVRRTLLAWKDHDDRALDRPLGCALSLLTARLLAGGQLLSHLPGVANAPILVVPAPSSPRSLRRRGRAHLDPVAAAVAGTLTNLGLSAVVSHSLVMRGIRGKSVAAGGRSDRASRVSGSIAVRETASLAGYPILVVDDIITTGSTIRQCARALTRAGGFPLTALALAAAPQADSVT